MALEQRQQEVLIEEDDLMYSYDQTQASVFHHEAVHRPALSSRMVSPFDNADGLSDIFSDADDQAVEEQKQPRGYDQLYKHANSFGPLGQGNYHLKAPSFSSMSH